MKAVILARISSKEQRDGHSLDAQIKNLKLYAERKSLEIVREYTLIESSTKGQRPEFDEMINFIKNQKEKMALVVDTVDRLQRSFRETPILNDLMQQDVLELHFVKEGNVLSKGANSSQKLMWNMGVVMAQSYTDQLSDNVRRSINFKVRNGEWCGMAPFGYLNAVDGNTGKATVIPDPQNAEIIKRIFKEYATGTYSLAELARKSREWGLRSKNGNKIGTQQLHHMIQNPFYYGVMKVKGKLYTHKYEPLITKTIFDICQHVRTNRGRTQAVKETRHPYLFRGLIKCAVSGRQVTCDLKKGKYVYLIVRDPENPKKKLWIKERDVLEQVEAVFASIQVPKSYLPDILEHINNTHESEKAYHHNSIKALNDEMEKTNIQTDKLTDLLIAETITKEIYDRKFAQLQQRRKEITVLQEEHQDGNEEFKVALSALVSLASKAPEIFKSSKTTIKRQLISLVFSNLQLSAGTLQYSLREPYKTFENLGDYKEWLSGIDTLRKNHKKQVILGFELITEEIRAIL